MRFEDVIRFVPTKQLESIAATNSTVDIYKFSKCVDELAFRERFSELMGRVFVPEGILKEIEAKYEHTAL